MRAVELVPLNSFLHNTKRFALSTNRTLDHAVAVINAIDEPRSHLHRLTS
jgi:hypothetical protein